MESPAQESTIAVLNDQFDFGNNKAAGLTNGQVASAINWILNQDFNSADYVGMFTQGAFSQDVTDAEIQAAVWKLTDNNLYLSQGLGQVEDAQKVYDLALEHTDFEPTIDDKIGLVIDPLEGGQPFVVAIEFEPYECVCDCDTIA